jgi:hypothetical protein
MEDRVAGQTKRATPEGVAREPSILGDHMP